MSFKKKKLQKNFSTNPKIRKLDKKDKKKRFSIIKFFLYLILLGIISILLLGFILWNKYIVDLPDVKDLENLAIVESSTIYDREGNELNKIFKEKRTYVEFERINKNMINALVSGEDKRYWENPGVDLIGISRAGLYFAMGKNSEIKGTSTITQQLIRNTIIENRSSQESFGDKLERKVKEFYLAYKLTQELSKEKILELYLNKISFGNNSFGIEQAAKTYFGTGADNLNILQSSILASLPKGPTFFSPYNHPDRLLGYPYTYIDNNDEENKIITKKDVEANKKEVGEIINFINSLKGNKLVGSQMLLCGFDESKLKNPYKIDSDGCTIIEFSSLLNFLNSIQIRDKDGKITEYQTGRKDFILQRMLEEEYITFDQYKEAIINSFGFEFNRNIEKMKYPHFVFYVREYLEQKYGKDVIAGGGFKIYTTIDPKIQDEAQKIIDKYSAINEKKFDANNAAVVTLDNINGEILAMIGSKDYYNKDISGENNIITSKLQPGSTFKPFVYSLAMKNSPVGNKTPVYDLETGFGSYKPANFDGKFMGKMNLSTALNNSRNIPAIKMYYMAGEEGKIEKFMYGLGVKTIEEEKQKCIKKGGYCKLGAPMALGTALMTPLELASAYSVFANMGVKKEMTPILKILDSNGNIVEDNTTKKESKVIKETQAYLMNYILSDSQTRPPFWNTYMTIKGRKLAAKTGTSTKQFIKNGRKQILPRNLWTIGYTPQYTTVAWVGNTSGKELGYKGNGLEGAGPIMRDVMTYIHKDKKVMSWKQPKGLISRQISKLSGLLPGEGFDSKLTTSSLFLNPPIAYDNSNKVVSVDILCNGKIGENTPVAAIKEVKILSFHSLKPDNNSWEDPVRKWIKEGGYKKEFGSMGNVLFAEPTKECDRSRSSANIQIVTNIKSGESLFVGSNYVEIGFRSESVIKRINILIGDEIINTVDIKNKKVGAFRGNINIPESYKGQQVIKIRIEDTLYYSETKNYDVIVIDKDKIPPEIIITNPSDRKIKLYSDEFFNLRGKIADRTPINAINIYVDGNPLKIGIKDREFAYPIEGENYSIGMHEVRIDAVDRNLNIGSTKVEVEVIKK